MDSSDAYSAAEMLCNTEYTPAPCNSAANLAAKDKLRGKTVVVGWRDDNTDIYQTPAGQLGGVFLQANYIESLLDGRLLHTIKLRWQVLLTLLWFILVEWPLHYWSDSALAPAVDTNS